jgi:hypothetical protein
VGTQGELATLSDSTVEGGPGLEDVLSNNDKLGNDSKLGLCTTGSFFYLSFLMVYSSYWLVTGVAWVMFSSQLFT